VLTRLMKFVSIVTLVLAAVIWNDVPPYERVFGFVVALGAVLAGVQAARAMKYRWAVAFYVVAIVFNPFLPTGAFSGGGAFAIVAASIGLFAGSLYVLKTQPLMSVPSITDRNPDSQSL
jgi:hypothetical protein